MLVLTADQVDSRHTADRVDAMLRELAERYPHGLVGAPERTAGDELQAATRDPRVALDAALHLVRAGTWSVGLGLGDAREPLGDSVRAMTGSAFVRAREAVTLAKKRSPRFAFVGEPGSGLDPLVRLLLALRERRTPEGWELADLLDADPAPTLTAAADERIGG